VATSAAFGLAIPAGMLSIVRFSSFSSRCTPRIHTDAACRTTVSTPAMSWLSHSRKLPSTAPFRAMAIASSLAGAARPRGANSHASGNTVSTPVSCWLTRSSAARMTSAWSCGPTPPRSITFRPGLQVEGVGRGERLHLGQDQVEVLADQHVHLGRVPLGLGLQPVDVLADVGERLRPLGRVDEPEPLVLHGPLAEGRRQDRLDQPPVDRPLALARQVRRDAAALERSPRLVTNASARRPDRPTSARSVVVLPLSCVWPVTNVCASGTATGSPVPTS
jgi:hypothetical protein